MATTGWQEELMMLSMLGIPSNYSITVLSEYPQIFVNATIETIYFFTQPVAIP